MQADPGWQKYLQVSAEAGYLIAQENKILVSVPFYAWPAELKALDDGCTLRLAGHGRVMRSTFTAVSWKSCSLSAGD